ncbi:MAG: hypothetical protein JW716_02080 [Candidatus Aenigmarchaeota archaeon]|nr:hypothetical protein [Candidatus Aenigmarchaeota archaeon]
MSGYRRNPALYLTLLATLFAYGHAEGQSTGSRTSSARPPIMTRTVTSSGEVLYSSLPDSATAAAYGFGHSSEKKQFTNGLEELKKAKGVIPPKKKKSRRYAGSLESLNLGNEEVPVDEETKKTLSFLKERGIDIGSGTTEEALRRGVNEFYESMKGRLPPGTTAQDLYKKALQYKNAVEKGTKYVGEIKSLFGGKKKEEKPKQGDKNKPKFKLGW